MKVVNGELAFRRREGEGWVAAGTLGWVEQVKLAGDCSQSTIVRAGSLEPHYVFHTKRGSGDRSLGRNHGKDTVL